MRKTILTVIDFFYIPWVSRWIPVRTFRYLACGCFTNALDIILFYISFHFILKEQLVHLPFITISAPIAAFIMAFCVSFPTGFCLSKYVVFPESELRGQTQLFRYLFIVSCCIGLNYVFLKFFIELCHIYPTVAKVLTTIVIAFFSFVTQKHFTFRVTSGGHETGVRHVS